MWKVLLELGVIKASTPLIIPGQGHFSIQTRRSAAEPREKPGLGCTGLHGLQAARFFYPVFYPKWI
jgi:hypothetical protein